jgi:hypothetical protein
LVSSGAWKKASYLILLLKVESLIAWLRNFHSMLLPEGRHLLRVTAE